MRLGWPTWEEPGSRPIYSISAVARMVGVPVATLRTWEERYALVLPDRNAAVIACSAAARSSSSGS